MQQSKQWLKRAASLCAEVGPEDGIDPRLLSRRYVTVKQGRKGRQLCKAAQRTLALLLGGEFRDPILGSLEVVDVSMVEMGASLLVSFRYQEDVPAVTEDQILHKLRRVEGVLRAAIAQSVTRKRVPALKFKQVWMDSEENSHAYS